MPTKLKKNIPLSAFISIVFIFSFSFSNGAFANVTRINDVLSSNAEHGVYLDLVNHNAISLNESGNFRPTEPINKAAFFKASMAYLGFEPVQGANHFTGYSDVPENSWFSPYIRKALEIRALTNVLNEEFHPEETLTRQEALVLTMRIYGIPTPLSTPSNQELFIDIRVNHPISPVYAAAKAHGIYIESNREDFRPNLTLTRGDAAILLFKAKNATLSLQNSTEGHVTITVSPPVSTENLTFSEEKLLENEKFGLMVDTWGRIHDSFLYQERISDDYLIYGAINGMVNTLDDPYSTFHTPDQEGESYVYIPEGYEGIGAVIEEIEGQYIIVTTINNSPAYRSGLKSKDIIVELNGNGVLNYTYEQIITQIKGKAGTLLKMKIKRDNAILNFDIIREKITIEAIQRNIVGNNINYLRIDQFTESSGDEFTNHVNEIIDNGSKKLIIDVRNNPGGYLSSTKVILEYFLKSGQVEFITEDNNGQQTKYYSEGEGQLKDWEIVVLVNEGSASASEIFAGALQDYDIAWTIGTTTFGKGSVQEITNYDDNSSLKLTIAKWLTSLGRNIDHTGLSPNQTVSITNAQRQAGQDPQLDAAINHLK